MRVLGIDVRWSDTPAAFPPATDTTDTPRKMWLRTQDAYTGLPAVSYTHLTLPTILLV